MSLIVDQTGIIPLCLGASVLHELGHCTVASILFKDGVMLHLSAFGAGLYIPPSKMVGWKYNLSLMAGPGINIIMFSLFYHSMPSFALVNLYTAVYNLFPIEPLDGGRLLSSFIRFLFSEKVSRMFVRSIDFIFIFFLGLICFYQILYKNINLSFLLLCLYLMVLFAKDS